MLAVYLYEQRLKSLNANNIIKIQPINLIHDIDFARPRAFYGVTPKIIPLTESMVSGKLSTARNLDHGSFGNRHFHAVYDQPLSCNALANLDEPLPVQPLGNHKKPWENNSLPF